MTTNLQPATETHWLVGASQRSCPFPAQTVFAPDAATYRTRCQPAMLRWTHATLTRYPRCDRNEAWVRLQGVAEALLGRPLYLDEVGLMQACARGLYDVWESDEAPDVPHDPAQLRRQITASLEVNRVRAGLETVLTVETIEELKTMLVEHQEGTHRVSSDRLGHYLAAVICSHQHLRVLVESRAEMAVAE